MVTLTVKHKWWRNTYMVEPGETVEWPDDQPLPSPKLAEPVGAAVPEVVSPYPAGAGPTRQMAPRAQLPGQPNPGKRPPGRPRKQQDGDRWPKPVAPPEA